MTEKVKHSRLFLWFVQVLKVCGRELLLVFRDEGVVIFFLLLNAVYPVLYALIYNPEVVRDERVVVIDDNRTAMSRDLIRRMDATQEVAIVGYAANMEEAREAMYRKDCYGILHVPRDFAQSVTRGEQGHISLYCDMSVMMRYKAMFTALTNVTQAMGNERLAAKIEPLTSMGGSIIESRQVPVGNPAMGIASAVLLFILPLVLQQSMILGIAMLHGGSIERRRRNGGRDPMAIEAGPAATIIGKMMCHQIVYVLPVIYVLHYVPLMFGFPQYGDLLHIICLAVPFIIVVSLMGQTLQAVVNERESVFLLFVTVMSACRPMVPCSIRQPMSTGCCGYRCLLCPSWPIWLSVSSIVVVIALGLLPARTTQTSSPASIWLKTASANTLRLKFRCLSCLSMKCNIRQAQECWCGASMKRCPSCWLCAARRRFLSTI